MTGPDTATSTRFTALRQVTAAAHDVDGAKPQGAAAVADAHHQLRAAVDAAREVRALWGEIGDALGIRRGNAYQQYRKRPPQAQRRSERG